MENTNESTTLICPQCGSEDITRSRRKRIIDRIISPLGFVPYRCNHYYCRARFYTRSPGKR